MSITNSNFLKRWITGPVYGRVLGAVLLIGLSVGLFMGNIDRAQAAEPVAGSLPASSEAVGLANTLIVLGDSISAGYGIPAGSGWVDLLQQQLVKRGSDWKVVNASISGETTKGGLARLPALLKRHRPKLVVVELGGNDGLRGYPLKRIRANLEKMAQLNEQIGAETIFLGMRLPPNYGGRYAKPFFDQYGELAEQYNAGLVPFILEGVATKDGLMQEDGIHPTQIAQMLLLEHVWKPLEPTLERLAQ